MAGVKLYRGDCLTLLPRVRPGTVDAVITDPPYSSGGLFRSDRAQTTGSKYEQGSTKAWGS